MEERRLSFKAMGSVNELHCYGMPAASLNSVCDEVITEVLRLEQKYSRYNSDTIVSRVNAAAGKERVSVDAETASLLNYADVCYKKSHSLFDITSGALSRAWDFKKGVVPSEKQLKESRKRVGWSRVSFTQDEILLPEGMEIDLGGVVKEYASDRVAAILRGNDITNALINLGGDIHIIGPHASGKPWRVGVSHPRRRDSALASVILSQGALATSGDYERYFESNGTRYCHIINPKTGWPVHELQSVTVCADSCLIAGSLSTMVMLLGKTRGLKLLKESEVFYLVVDRCGEIFTNGPFELNNLSETNYGEADL